MHFSVDFRKEKKRKAKSSTVCKYSPYREADKLQHVLVISLSANKYSRMPLLTNSRALAYMMLQKTGLFKVFFSLFVNTVTFLI